MTVAALWKPLAQKPTEDGPRSALIAALEPGDEEPFLLTGVYMWRRGTWAHEDTGEPIKEVDGGRYWWAWEGDLLAMVPLMVEAA